MTESRTLVQECVTVCLCSGVKQKLAPQQKLCSVSVLVFSLLILLLSATVLNLLLPRAGLLQQDEYHMMHLVCTSRSPPASPSPTANTPESSVSNCLRERERVGGGRGRELCCLESQQAGITEKSVYAGSAV